MSLVPTWCCLSCRIRMVLAEPIAADGVRRDGCGQAIGRPAGPAFKVGRCEVDDLRRHHIGLVISLVDIALRCITASKANALGPFRSDPASRHKSSLDDEMVQQGCRLQKSCGDAGDNKGGVAFTHRVEAEPHLAQEFHSGRLEVLDVHAVVDVTVRVEFIEADPKLGRVGGHCGRVAIS